MKYSIIVCCAFLAAQALAAPVTNMTQIASNRQSVALQVTNSQRTDELCDAKVNVVVSQDAFDDIAGEFSVVTQPFYLTAGSSTTISGIGYAQLKLYGPKPPPWISRANAQVDCKSASFADYCDYAPKSANDNYTIQKILDRAGKNDCGLAENEIGKNLDLSGQNIVSLKPVGFLKDLRWLNLSNNKIQDLGPLRGLMNLQRLNVSSNPIVDIRPLLEMASIRSIKANRTDVCYDPTLTRAPNLKRVELIDTPYAKKIKCAVGDLAGNLK